MNIIKNMQDCFKGGKEISLSSMEYFMKKFDNPEKKLKVIHIAGTNGKGSVTEMISNVLINAGYKVGKFMSPHLIKHNERISVNNKPIEDSEFENIINELNPLITEYNQTHEMEVSLFELRTIIAILYFYRNNCDFAVFEVGLGGLCDSTNILNPIVSIITSIGYDHMNILGDTIDKIAIQKAGIIKENSNTVYFKQTEKQVNSIIEKTCKEKNNKLHLISNNDINNYTYDEKYQKFDYKDYKDIEINLKGKKQVYNASLCLEAIDILRKDYKIAEEAIRTGLKTVIHKARFEKIFDNPEIIYDGAHNTPAIKNLKTNIDMYYKDRKKVYIFSVLERKDYHQMLNELMTDKAGVYIFTSGNFEDKYVTKEELYYEVENLREEYNLTMLELKDAINLAVKDYKDYAIFVIGSFYTYSTVIDILNDINNK